MKTKDISSAVFLILILICSSASVGLRTQTKTQTTGSDRILQDQSITTNQGLSDPSGIFSFSLQSDGNMVIYGCFGIATWGSNTANSTKTRVLAMQGDGNLVLYENGVGKWSSQTAKENRLTTYNYKLMVIWLSTEVLVLYGRLILQEKDTANYVLVLTIIQTPELGMTFN
jgi:hypothetical protein